MAKRILLLSNILLLILSFELYATGPEASTTAASFLKIGVGPRPVGMGGAFCAIADDGSALFWNPAGIGLMKEKELTCIYNILFEDTGHSILGYVHPIRGQAFGVGINHLTISGIGEVTEEDPTGTERTFEVQDIACSLSYGRRFGKDLSLGMNLKYIQQRIEREKATGYGVDVGMLYKPSALGLGLAVQNIGPEIKFIERGFPLPLNFKAGISYPYKNFCFVLDANKPIDKGVAFSLGAESWWAKILTLRAGYKIETQDNRLRGLVGMTGGIGLNLGDLRVDYAFTPFGDLGNIHQISLNFSFKK